MHISAVEEATLTNSEPEPQGEMPEPPTAEQETAQSEPTASVPAITEPEVIEGEVMVIDQPEETTDPTPSKQKPYWLLIPFTILCCLMFLGGSFLLPLLTPTATVAIIPAEKTVSITTAIQVRGRQLAPLTLMQRASVAATEKRHQNPTRAAGTITFYNGLLSAQTIAAGTVFTGSDGTQVVTDQPAIIPPANPPLEGHVAVPADALLVGASGNIPAYDINTACCATSVVAKNTRAFTGGAPARDLLLVTRTDLNNAVTSLLVLLNQSEDAALQAQLHTSEQLITPSCTPSVSSDHKPGDEAKYVSVTVSVTCSGIAYDAHKLYANATQMIPRDVLTKLGATYARVGGIQVAIVHAAITDTTRGIATLSVKLDATYVYQLSPGEKQHLVRLLAGKTKQQAINTLLHFPGIQATSIQLAGGNTALPADPNRIHIIVMYQTR